MLVWRVLCAGVGVLSAGVEGPVCWCGMLCAGVGVLSAGVGVLSAGVGVLSAGVGVLCAGMGCCVLVWEC